MIRRWILPSFVLFLLHIVRITNASDAKSFFAYIKEIAEPIAPENGREGRQLAGNGGLSLTFALNGVSNFTFNVANIPTNFAVACGGDDRNYCNYPDLPLIETYDLNYYSRRPIPSGRCPDGYTKMPTFDCLNIAPALFETTCCMFTGSNVAVTTNSICTSNIDAMWTLCNGTIYIASGAFVWLYNQDFSFRAGPIMLAAVTGGCISRDLSEAEVLGDCSVQFFNLNDQYYTVDYASGSLGCSGPFLDSNIGLTGTPSLVFGAGLGTNIYKIDGDGFQVALPSGFNFICGGNTTNSIQVTAPGAIGQYPLQNCTAATYLPSRDLICFICQFGTSQIICTTRQGVNVTSAALASTLSNCGSTTTTNVAPVVYIPYPIYPVFTGQQSPSPSPYGSSSYGSSPSSYGSSPPASYGSSPSSYSAPSPSPVSYGSAPMSSYSAPAPAPSPVSYGSSPTPYGK